MIVDTGWLKQAADQPIAFSQVREDPEIDLRLANSLGANLNVTMVASGGCTAASLVGTGRIGSLNLVDLNPSQIALTRFKLHLFRECSQRQKLGMLGHENLPAGSRRTQVGEILTKLDLPPDIFGNPDVWSKVGLDQCGRYELLFAELRRQMGPTPRSLSSEQRAQVFKRVMSQDNLVVLFGPEATANRVIEFWKHFHRQTENALVRDNSGTNPYLCQMLQGKFESTHYDWLSRGAPLVWPQVFFQNQEMAAFLKSLQTNSQDFIHLSNILDWLPLKEARRTLSEAGRVLRDQGLLVVRQLNSALSVPDMGPKLEWQPRLSESLLKTDKSFFYQALHVARGVG